MSPAATTSGERSSLTELTLLWYGLAAGAGWWAVHLVALAALVPGACGRPWVLWLMHGVTLVCAAGTVAAIASAGRLRRPGRRAATAVDVERDRFLGRLGQLIGVASLVLILLEDLPVWFVPPC